MTTSVYLKIKRNPLQPWSISDETLKSAFKCRIWCIENLEQGTWNYYGMYQRTPGRFIFSKPEDATMFKLLFAEHIDKSVALIE